MSSASRCLSRAVRYARFAQRSEDPEIRRTFAALAVIWREMMLFSHSVDGKEEGPAAAPRYRAADEAQERRRVA